MSSEVESETKKALLAMKQKLLRDISNCEKRIDLANLNRNQAFYDDEDSSDSDSGFPIPVDLGPSTKELKMQSSSLSVCLQASQELTGLCVLESEVVVLTTPPALEKGPPPTTEGLWREVTAECRVDLVPFSIMFYIHQPNAKFAPATYHDLKVTVVKAAHDKELAKSVLKHAARPSDAVQILRSYAVAHRSRRTTLARLSEKYAETLFMEALPEGGYILKCVNLLEISWTLTNKWSPIAPFHHRLKFDIEYMDEASIRTIKQAHKLLMDPSLNTNERTELLSNIIDTCIEANGGISSVQDSDFDPQISPIKPTKRPMSIEEEPAQKKVKDSEVMAPPKSFPKKSKRASDVNMIGEAKNGKDIAVNKVKTGDNLVKDTKNSDVVAKKANVVKTSATNNDKLPAKKSAVVTNNEVKKTTVVTKKKPEVVKNADVQKTAQKVTKKKDEAENDKNVANNVDKPKKDTVDNVTITKKNDNKVSKSDKIVANNNEKSKKDIVTNKNASKNYENKSDKQNIETNKVANKNTEAVKPIKDSTNNKVGKNKIIEKGNILKTDKPKKVIDPKTTIEGNKEGTQKGNVPNVANKIVKTTENMAEKPKSADGGKKSPNIDPKNTVSDTKTVPKKTITTKFNKPTNEQSVKMIKKVVNGEGKVMKPVKSSDKIISGKKIEVDKKNIQKTVEKVKTKIPLPKNMKKPILLSKVTTNVTVNTQIPKKLSAVNEKMFKNPLRMSPRTIKKPSVPKTSSMFALENK